jgi:hypothetical protein
MRNNPLHISLSLLSFNVILEPNTKVNVVSIQHQNHDGHWHHVANSLAKSLHNFGHQTELFCPNSYIKTQEEFQIRNVLDPKIGQTPDNWSNSALKNFATTVRGLTGNTIMYDGRIPMLLLVLIASRKMNKDSIFFLNILGASIERKKHLLDIRDAISRYALKLAKSQDRIQIFAESQELSDYIMQVSGYSANVFPVFAPNNFDAEQSELRDGNLVLLEDEESTALALSEISTLLSTTEKELKITVWINRANPTFLRYAQSNVDNRLKFVHGYLSTNDYEDLMKNNFRHLFFYDAGRYEFRTSGKLMESILLERSLAIPEYGTFKTLTRKYYKNGFSILTKNRSNLQSTILSDPVNPQIISSGTSNNCVIELSQAGHFSRESSKRISLMRYVACRVLLSLITASYKMLEYRRKNISRVFDIPRVIWIRKRHK